MTGQTPTGEPTNAGDDVHEDDGGQPIVAPEQEPRGYRRMALRYRTYLRLLAASLVVGLTVGVGSGWYSMPPATREWPTTCYEWNYFTKPMPNSITDCSTPVRSADELQRLYAGQRRVIRVWQTTQTGRVDRGDWPLAAVRNGLIAAGVAYLILILIVVPARMLKRPD